MKSSDTIASVLASKNREMWSVEPTATVYRAIEMMAERRVGALLVMSQGKLVGVVSERDYARKVILMDRSSRHCSVQDIMTSPVITVTPDDTVDQCMKTMTENRVRHLPVVQGEEVVGIVTIGDLVKWTITLQEETIGQLQSYISGSYPG
jgi:CBS domain-containing protein